MSAPLHQRQSNYSVDTAENQTAFPGLALSQSTHSHRTEASSIKSAVNNVGMPTPKPYSHFDFLRFVVCAPFFLMVGLLIVEAALSALTTWLVIQAGQDLANEDFLLADFAWIVAAQSASYLVGALSWIFAERAGFGAFGRYMLRFAKENKAQTRLLGNKAQRETVEPFLTNESFHIFFELVYELEADLKLFFNLLFNMLVLGFAIDAGLPFVYGLVFAALLAIQISLRKFISNAYADNQRATNRMTAHTYTAWDNVLSGNRYNFRLWHGGFKTRLRDALRAQIRSIMTREGIAAFSGIFALVSVFAYLALVAAKSGQNSALLISLAATLPKQIDMSYSLHGLATGWNDLLAVWTRVKGAAHAMRPTVDAGFDARIRFDELHLLQSHALVGASHAAPVVLKMPDLNTMARHIQNLSSGRIQVRGSNGAGKSTLLAALKAELGAAAFYWPTTGQLSFVFNAPPEPVTHPTAGLNPDDGVSDDDNDEPESERVRKAFSSGEQQLQTLREIVRNTASPVYLLDEWDANLDQRNATEAQQLVMQLAQRAVVVEISHRD